MRAGDLCYSASRVPPYRRYEYPKPLQTAYLKNPLRGYCKRGVLNLRTLLGVRSYPAATSTQAFTRRAHLKTPYGVTTNGGGIKTAAPLAVRSYAWRAERGKAPPSQRFFEAPPRPLSGVPLRLRGEPPRGPLGQETASESKRIVLTQYKLADIFNQTIIEEVGTPLGTKRPR